MKLALIALLVLGVAACTPSPEVTSHLTITTKGKTTGWTYVCDKNESFCSPNSLANARTMHMGEGLYYTCSITGELYMSRESYRAMTNLEPVKGATCDFEVLVNNK